MRQNGRSLTCREGSEEQSDRNSIEPRKGCRDTLMCNPIIFVLGLRIQLQI